MATLEDVAREVGCSIATVSRALNDHPRISALTRERVHEASKRLGYRGNALVRATLQRQKTIGLVIPSIRYSHYYDDTSLLHDVLSEQGYKIILSCHHNDVSRDKEILESLMRHPVDGIIHTPCTPNGYEDLVARPTPIPIVEIGTRTPSQRADVVSANEDAAIAELIHHLVELGHHRIALLTGRNDLYHVRRRAESFRVALRERGVDDTDCPVVFGPSNVQWFRETTRDLLNHSERMTAAIPTNKPALVGALLAAKERRLRIPEDMSILSFTAEDWHAAMSPAVSSFAHPFQEMGMMAAQILIQRIEPHAATDHDPRLVKFSGEIIERESTAPPPEATSSKDEISASVG